MIGTTFNEQLQIIEVKFKGPIELDELLQFVFNIGQNKYLSGHCKLIIDATESMYHFGAESLRRLTQNIEANTARFLSLRVAVIHHNTTDTAISMTLERDYKFTSYRHKTFCTREAALAWLDVMVAC